MTTQKKAQAPAAKKFAQAIAKTLTKKVKPGQKKGQGPKT